MPTKKAATKKPKVPEKDKVTQALANSYISQLTLHQSVKMIQQHYYAIAKEEVDKLNKKGIDDLKEKLRIA